MTPPTAPHSLQRNSTVQPSTAAMMQPQQSTPAESCTTLVIDRFSHWHLLSYGVNGTSIRYPLMVKLS